jgi:hypothetical protein
MENVSLEISVYKLEDRILIEFILAFYIGNTARSAETVLGEVESTLKWRDLNESQRSIRSLKQKLCNPASRLIQSNVH